jgi:hypothetical protein
MLSQIYYLIRSRVDGSYLAAYPKGNTAPEQRTEQEGYLLIFREHFDALSYLNKFAKDVSDRFAVESMPGTQLKGLLNRWGFKGVGVVQDPLLPNVEFLSLK